MVTGLRLKKGSCHSGRVVMFIIAHFVTFVLERIMVSFAHEELKD
jgi:hypothetical protein